MEDNHKGSIFSDFAVKLIQVLFNIFKWYSVVIKVVPRFRRVAFVSLEYGARARAGHSFFY